MKNVELLFITSDTMDSYSRYGVWAWDVNDNMYLIEDGEVPYLELTPDKRVSVNEERKADNLQPVVTLEDVLDKEYLVENGIGIKPTFLVIDVGGHRGDEVKHFAKMHKNVIMQRGTAMTATNWKPSDNIERFMLTNEKYFKSTLIYYLYSQKNKQENYLYFNPDISEATLAEFKDIQPDNTSKWGSAPENWQPKTGTDHIFDCR